MGQQRMVGPAGRNDAAPDDLGQACASAAEGLLLLEAFRGIRCAATRSRIVDLVQAERQRWSLKTAH